MLESGSPDGAAEYFTRALKLVPDLTVRPIIAYYLEKLGKPVPELPKKADLPQPRAGDDGGFDCFEAQAHRPRLLPWRRPNLPPLPPAPAEPAKPGNATASKEQEKPKPAAGTGGTKKKP